MREVCKHVTASEGRTTMVVKKLWSGAWRKITTQPASRSVQVAAADLPRYAAKGFAFDCLSQGLKMDSATGLPVDTTWLQVKAGELTCGGPDMATAQGPALLAALLFLHLSLMVGPIYGITLFYSLEKDSTNQTAVKSPAWLLAAMGVFSIASLGEIALHIHDNWLYINLIPSFYNAVFYGGLSAGQVALAFAMKGTKDRLNRFSAALVPVAILAMIISTLMSANDAASPSVPGDFVVVWAIVFGSLGFSTIAFVRGCFQSGVSVRHWLYTIGVAFSYGLGVFFSIKMSDTGNQLWHIPTASGFLSGFVVQVFWIRSMMKTSTPSEGKTALSDTSESASV